jgi:hypothetical protein
VPGGERRSAVAPAEVGEAEVEIGQAAADRDVADAEARGGKGRRVALEAVERGAGLDGEAVEELRQVRALRLVALVPPQDEDVEQAVAEGVAGEGGPAFRPCRREQRAAAREGVEVFADHHGVLQDGAVAEHQRRDLAQRVVGQQVGVRLRHADHGADAVDAVRQA